jgi:signal peptidase
MKLSGLIAWIAVVVIITPFLLFVAPQVIGAIDAYIVKSGSMEPSIPTGSVIFVRNVQPSQVTPGDVITFRTETPQPDPRIEGEGPMEDRDSVHMITHRVVEKQDNGDTTLFKTKGDANENADPGWVEGDRLVGESFLTVPYFGYLLVWLGSLQALILLVILPAFLLVLLEITSIVRETR